jgi:hypothetical protein
VSDPFDRLRDVDTSAYTPDVTAIRSRARKIERRRGQMIGGSAVAVVLVAVAGIVFSTRPGHETSNLAEQKRAAATPSLENAPFAAADTAASPVPSTALKSAAAPATGARDTQAGNTASTSQGAAVMAAPSLNVTVHVKDHSVGRGADLTLQACNPSTETSVDRSFGSAQRYDFVAKRGGKVVWKWSDGRAFAEAVGEEHWAPKQCKSWTVAWDGSRSGGGPAGPGTYEITGMLTTSPATESAPVKYCLDVC